MRDEYKTKPKLDRFMTPTYSYLFFWEFDIMVLFSLTYNSQRKTSNVKHVEVIPSLIRELHFVTLSGSGQSVPLISKHSCLSPLFIG